MDRIQSKQLFDIDKFMQLLQTFVQKNFKKCTYTIDYLGFNSAIPNNVQKFSTRIKIK